jgi:hypothetical protein
MNVNEIISKINDMNLQSEEGEISKKNILGLYPRNSSQNCCSSF